jgi:exopolysaccharide biosynthesis protein
MAHSNQHVKALQQVPVTAEAAKPYLKILNDLHGFGVQFAGNVQKALVKKQQQSGQGQDPKVQREQAMTQAKVQSLALSTHAEIQRKNAAHQAKMKNLQETHRARQMLKIRDNQVSSGLKALQTVGQMEMDKHRSLAALANEGD